MRERPRSGTEMPIPSPAWNGYSGQAIAKAKDFDIMGGACHTQCKSFEPALERAGFKEAWRAPCRALAETGLRCENVLIGSKT